MEAAVCARQARDNLRDANHGELVGIDDCFDPCAAHQLAATAENLNFRQARMQSRGQPGAVDVPGSFPGHYHQSFIHGTIHRRAI